MKKQEYQKPVMEVIEADIEQQILASSYTGIQSKNSTDDDDPDYDGSSSGYLWDAN